jgi:hypothetical protein
MTTSGYKCVTNIYSFSHLADAFIQSDLQEQLGLSALLNGTSADFFYLVGSAIRTGDLSVTVLALLTARISPAHLKCYVLRCYVMFPTVLMGKDVPVVGIRPAAS